MPRDEHHIIPSRDGGWYVKRNGATRASAQRETKSEAMKIGRQISKKQGTEMIVHGRDGRIQNPDSHSNDPCPPRDKK